MGRSRRPRTYDNKASETVLTCADYVDTRNFFISIFFICFNLQLLFVRIVMYHMDDNMTWTEVMYFIIFKPPQKTL